MFEHGTIVLNFRRSKVYSFDSGNKLHRLESSYCRVATFEECRKFEKLKVVECKLSEIGIRRDWKQRDEVSNNHKKISLQSQMQPLIMLSIILD